MALRLLGNRLFRSTTIATVLVSIAFFGTLFLISLYYQDARGLSALDSGLSTFPEALGVMIGAQLASRVLYPRLGPRRHVLLGLTGTDERRWKLTVPPRSRTFPASAFLVDSPVLGVRRYRPTGTRSSPADHAQRARRATSVTFLEEPLTQDRTVIDPMPPSNPASLRA